MNAISERRHKANSFFLAVNTTMEGLVSYLKIESLIIPIVGAILCMCWYALGVSYQQMNSGKFKVIHALENELPLAPYRAEWEALAKGLNPTLYTPFTKIEQFVPLIFFLLHIVAICSLVFKMWE
jgi:hypothetical protein